MCGFSDLGVVNLDEDGGLKIMKDDGEKMMKDDGLNLDMDLGSLGIKKEIRDLCEIRFRV